MMDNETGCRSLHPPKSQLLTSSNYEDKNEGYCNDLDDARSSTNSQENLNDLSSSGGDIHRPSKFPIKSEKDILLRKVRSVLNKISSLNYHRLRKRWLNLMPHQQDAMSEVLQLLVHKALDDQIYMHIYARMMGYLVSRKPQNQANLIRIILNTQIHHELKRLTTDKEIAKFNNQPESEAVARRKKVTLHRFISELYSEKVINTRFIVERISDLISYRKQEDADENLECLCVVLTFAGQKLEENRGEWLSEVIEKFQRKEAKEKARGAISMRVQFMIMDLFEMHGKHWAPHNKWWARAVQIGDQQSSHHQHLQAEKETSVLTRKNFEEPKAKRFHSDTNSSRDNSINNNNNKKKPDLFVNNGPTLRSIFNKVSFVNFGNCVEMAKHILLRNKKENDLFLEIEFLFKIADDHNMYLKLHLELIEKLIIFNPLFGKLIEQHIINRVTETPGSRNLIRFFGELYNFNIIRVEKITPVIEALMKKQMNEPLCYFFFVAGKKLEDELKIRKMKINFCFEDVFKTLETNIKTMEGRRLIFFMEDLKELRGNRWVLNRSLNWLLPVFDVPKTSYDYDVQFILKRFEENQREGMQIIREKLKKHSVCEKFVYDALLWTLNEVNNGAEQTLLKTTANVITAIQRSHLLPTVRLRKVLGRLVQKVSQLRCQNQDSSPWVNFGLIMEELYTT